MDWLTFISTVIKALAWPAAVTVLVILCRKQLASALERLTDFEFAGSKFKFGNVLSKIENTPPSLNNTPAMAPEPQPPVVAAQPNNSADAPTPIPTSLDELAALVRKKLLGDHSEYQLNKMPFLAPPPYRVLQAWDNLVSAVVRKIQEIDPARTFVEQNFRGIMDFVRTLGLSASDISKVLELYNLRNKVAHGFDDVSASDATRYENLVTGFINDLNNYNWDKGSSASVTDAHS